jgi:hypothetical protein
MRVPKQHQQLYGQSIRARLSECEEEAAILAKHLSNVLKQSFQSNTKVKVCIDQALRSVRPAKTTFAAIAEEYITTRQVDHKSSMVAIRALLTVAGDRKVESYKRDDARALLAYLQSIGNKTATIRRRFNTINAVMNFAYQELEIDRHNLFSKQTVASTITTKALTITGMAAINKTYDDSTVASLTGGLLSTGISGETLTFTGQTGTFADKNVANGIAVTVANTTLVSGTGLANNYSVVQPTGLTANIAAFPSIPDVPANSVFDAPTDGSVTVTGSESTQDIIFTRPGAYRMNKLPNAFRNECEITSLPNCESEESEESE